ncbi:MAG: 5'-3' exonuclease H3TH domain-containing protein, partial [Lachnospiraceae bacterium]
MESKKIVLIDGHSILNRAFYGIPLLSNAKGLHTNAVYGFLNILFKILEEEKPQYLAVAFDVSAPTFRHEMYREYKGTRKPMPEELREQVPVMKQVLSAMGIKICEQAGLEADDILGTLAKTGEREGIQVSLVSGDRDLLQIASGQIKIRIPKTKGARTEIEDYYAADVKAAYGVTPLQFIELKALMGDTADNIPGVPKVGQKTAEALMTEYGSIDRIYENLENITKKSIRESLRENRELADLSKALATIKTDCELDFTLEDAKLGNLYTPEAYTLFKELEFKNFLGRFEAENTVRGEEITEHFRTITDLAGAEAAFAACEKADRTGYLLMQDKAAGKVCAVSLCWSDNDICVIKAEGFLTGEYLSERLGRLQDQTMLCGFHMKDVYPYFATDNTDKCFDIQIAAYLLNPLKNDYTIEDIANEHLNLMFPGYTESFGKKSMAEAMESEPEKF